MFARYIGSTQSCSDFFCHGFWKLKRVFPKPENRPAPAAENSSDFPIALPVAVELGNPIGAVGCRCSGVARASMPKTTIYKHSKALRAKNKIRRSRKRLVSPPASNPGSAKNRDKLQFGDFVSTRVYCSHDG
jgi:hypothetical protein